VNTLKIMRGAVAAQALGCFERYVDAMYAAMWEQQRNMSDDAQIADVLGAAGLDAQAIADKSQDPDVKARLLANTESAAERGAFGSPTFFVGNEIWFGKEHLRDVEEEIVRLTR
jgi:2-hydroxychromene-2-carboxylate isomerase